MSLKLLKTISGDLRMLKHICMSPSNFLLEVNTGSIISDHGKHIDLQYGLLDIWYIWEKIPYLEIFSLKWL